MKMDKKSSKEGVWSYFCKLTFFSGILNKKRIMDKNHQISKKNLNTLLQQPFLQVERFIKFIMTNVKNHGSLVWKRKSLNNFNPRCTMDQELKLMVLDNTKIISSNFQIFFQILTSKGKEQGEWKNGYYQNFHWQRYSKEMG